MFALADLPAKARQRIKVVGECWIWIGALRSKKSPYGAFYWNGKTRLAHRVIYELMVGPIPEGLQLDHIVCDTPLCVHPGHLVPATPRANTLRSSSPSAVNAKRKKCKNGHPLSGKNLYVRSNGWRQCRACHRRNVAKHYRSTRV